MKLKKFNEHTNHDMRDSLSDLSKEMHKKGVSEVYFIDDDKYVTKWIIPEKYTGEFEEEYTGGDYGSFYKDTAEYLEMKAEEMEASWIVMDYEIDEFIENLQNAKTDKGENFDDFD